MSVAISWDNKMQLAKCDIMVGFPISSHIYIYAILKYQQVLHVFHQLQLYQLIVARLLSQCIASIAIIIKLCIHTMMLLLIS